MTYLVILVIVAALGIARLYLAQRRQRSHLQTVETFATGLQRLADPLPEPEGPKRKPAAPRQRPRPRARRRPRITSGPIAPLDPARREAARRRIQARRARSGLAG